jgi:acetyl-CoA acetyltransferase
LKVRRNPIQDQVAIVGIGQTPYARNHAGQTDLSLGLEAARAAIVDAGLTKNDIDGMCGFAGSTEYEAVHEALGIARIDWYLNNPSHMIPPHAVAAAAFAVFSGACETALVVMGSKRGMFSSRSAANDPFRVRASRRAPRGLVSDLASMWVHAPDGYSAWAGRYLKDFGVPREVFGMIAVNSRTNAIRNPNAAMRAPLTMDDYLNARLVREPHGLLDMDVPVDHGDALVITTAERARDLAKPPVYLHAIAFSEFKDGVEYYENGRSYKELSMWATGRKLWERSELQLKDVDLFIPYDGFTNIAVADTEAFGWCGPGEAYDFLRQNWDVGESRIKVGGRVAFSSHGGSLSHGASQGFSYFHEAALQLRGEAGERQLSGCRVALLTPGGFYHNSTGFVLRAA